MEELPSDLGAPGNGECSTVTHSAQPTRQIVEEHTLSQDVCCISSDDDSIDKSLGDIAGDDTTRYGSK